MMDGGVVVWLTGLPASGKSTLAARVRSGLRRPSVVLDSDDMRTVFETESYGEDDRERFYRVLAKLAANLARQGLVVLVPATAHRHAYRERARELAPKFVEVWVRTSAEDCARRDTKGLYARARAGEIGALPGIGTSYEPPTDPELVAESGFDDAAVQAIVALVEEAR
jgi:adenylylsulfate kinase